MAEHFFTHPTYLHKRWGEALRLQRAIEGRLRSSGFSPQGFKASALDPDFEHKRWDQDHCCDSKVSSTLSQETF